jgi:hypothetical protein
MKRLPKTSEIRLHACLPGDTVLPTNPGAEQPTTRSSDTLVLDHHHIQIRQVRSEQSETGMLFGRFIVR